MLNFRMPGSIKCIFMSSLVLFLFSSPQSQAGEENQATTVGIDRVVYRNISQFIPVSARLVARQAGIVAARINAPIEEVLVQIGDEVSNNQILVRLDNARLLHQKELRTAELERAKAVLTTASAQLNIVSQELKRLKRLKKSAAFNQARFDDKRLEVVKAQSGVVESEAAVRKAIADLALAELDLNYSEIKAPYPATITMRHVERGGYVSIGQAVMTLTNTENLEIEADITTQQIKALKPGVSVNVILGNDIRLKAKVRAVVPEENPLTRTRAVRFSLDFDIKEHHLASNQTLRLEIPLNLNKKILSLAKDAVLIKKGQKMVFAVIDAKAVITPVKLGKASGNYFEVKSGLKEGDIVVVRGNERLRPNQAVIASGAKQ